MSTNPSSVILADWNTPGHHSTYMCLYAQAFAELGLKVGVLFGDAGALGAMKLPVDAQVAIEPLPRTVFKKPWPQPLRSWLNHRAFKRNFCIGLRKCEEKLNQRASLLFFNSLFAHEHNAVRTLVDLGGLPWSGLLVHALPDGPGKNAMRMRELMLRPDIKAYGTLDESLVAREKNTAHPAVCFPDIADERVDPAHPVVDELRRFARGRPLVLAIGYLQPWKGIVTLAEIASRPENADIAFAFVGELRRSMFSGEQLAFLDSLRANATNCYFKNERISGEIAYNAHIQACDVLFLAYHDFRHSSNSLTKAAAFRKPIIVSEGYLMASRTREYRLGEIVSQGDAAAVLRAIRDITGNSKRWTETVAPRWDAYRELHSFGALKKSISSLLDAYGIKTNG